MFQILTCATADKREFIKISQAVGMGFLVMVSAFSIALTPRHQSPPRNSLDTANIEFQGAIGYFVKLSKYLIVKCNALFDRLKYYRGANPTIQQSTSPSTRFWSVAHKSRPPYPCGPPSNDAT